MNTIAAAASGISIIRLSGKASLEIVSKIFKSKSPIADHAITYGKIYDTKIVDNKEVHELVDEVLVSYMAAPRSYTAEDVIEIYSHSNFFIVSRILSILLKNGAKEAEQGEFTKRAFLNGRIDLTQAESVADLINGSSEKSIEASLKNLSGLLKSRVSEIRQNLIDFISHVNALADYPEEVDDNIEFNIVKSILNEVTIISDSYSTGRKIRSGASVAIIGKPNVGKSTLMNRLLKYDRALVSGLAGTTRDIIEDTFFVKGLAIRLLDTAGIRESGDIVERMGIRLSKKAMNEADLILFVVDASKPLDEEEKKLLEEIESLNSKKGTEYLIVFNKVDLYGKDSNFFDSDGDNNTVADGILDSSNDNNTVDPISYSEDIENREDVENKKNREDTDNRYDSEYNDDQKGFDLNGYDPNRYKLDEIFLLKQDNLVHISAKKSKDLENLEELIFEKVFGKNLQSDKLLLDNVRHRDLFLKVKEALEEFISSSAPLDIRSTYIISALNSLGEIVGEITNEDILDNIFKNFCLGK